MARQPTFATTASRGLRSSHARLAVLLTLCLFAPYWSAKEMKITTADLRDAPRAIKQKVWDSGFLPQYDTYTYIHEELELSPHPRIQDHVLHVHQHPVSSWRPHNQFSTAPINLVEKVPVFALGTVIRDPTRDLIDLTYRSLAQSSLKLWHWFIIDDGTAAPDSLAILQELTGMDSRISVSSPAGKNAAKLLHSQMMDSGALYGAVLNPYTMYEHTMLEKSAWALASVTTWNIVGHFEGGEELNAGVHSGKINLEVGVLYPSVLTAR